MRHKYKTSQLVNVELNKRQILIASIVQEENKSIHIYRKLKIDKKLKKRNI